MKREIKKTQRLLYILTVQYYDFNSFLSTKSKFIIMRVFCVKLHFFLSGFIFLEIAGIYLKEKKEKKRNVVMVLLFRNLMFLFNAFDLN